MTQGNLAVPHRHIVLAAYEAWGHTRPICSLAARLVKSGPVNVTFFTTMSFYDRVSAELVRNFDVHDVNTRERIRLVALENLGESFLDSRSLNVGFEKAYQQLVEESSVTCAKTLTEFPAIPSPDTAIFDIFASQMLAAVRFYSKQPVKVYGWMVCSAAAYQHLFGAVSPNKNGDLRSFIYEEAERSGNSIAEIVEQIFFNTTGEVLSIPGLPPMYDYETAPQHMTVPQSDVGTLMISGAEFIDGCDGVLIATPHAFETPETLEGLAKRMDGNIHVVGPMLASGGDTHGTERKQAAMAQEIDDFMGRIHETRGPKSLVYISFGTVWWSPEPEKIWALLDVMMKRKIPFVFSHGSPLAQIPDDVRAKVEQSGLGLFSPWSPQQYILSHPVTGWFVTHCGYNSVLESIGAGVPMICWPFHADQPTNAIHLTENLDIAYELLEVRTGQGLKPIYRTGKAPIGTLDAVREEAHYVFEKAFGEDGELKRNNIQGLQTSFAKAWEEQGPAHLALRRFLESSAPS